MEHTKILKTLLLIVFVLSTACFMGCSKKEKTVGGALIGAAAGAGIGAAAGNTGGAVAGGAIGAVAGGLIGHSMGDDKKEKNKHRR